MKIDQQTAPLVYLSYSYTLVTVDCERASDKGVGSTCGSWHQLS